MRTALTLILLLLGALSNLAVAQSSSDSTSFCAINYANQHQCFNTLVAAEGWMKQEPATPRGRALLEPVGDPIPSGPLLNPSSYSYEYAVKPRPPEARLESYLYALAYSGTLKCGCSDQDGPTCGWSDIHGCVSQSGDDDLVYEAIDRTYGDSSNYCDYSTQTLTGWPSPPISSSPLSNANGTVFPPGNGAFYYHNGAAFQPNPLAAFNKQVILESRRKLSNGTCGNPSQSELVFWRQERYQCAVGLTARSANINTQGGVVSNVISESEVCASGERGFIYTKVVPGPHCDKVGNPCVPATGEKIQQETDAGVGSLQLQRFYSSLPMARSNSYLGRGWWHSFSDYLAVPAAGTRNHYFYAKPGGQFERFDRIGTSSSFKSTATVGLALEQLPDGTFELNDGLQIRSFDTIGRLTRSAPLDNPAAALDIIYLPQSDSVPSDAVSAVADAQGRQMSFEYGPANESSECDAGGGVECRDIRLLAALMPDGSSVRYEYDLQGRLESTHYDDDKGRRYHYNEPDNVCPASAPDACAGAPPDGGFPGALTGISEFAGSGVKISETRLSNYQYDDRGRVISSARVGDLDRVMLSYPSLDTAVVTFPEGRTRTFSYARQAGAFRKVTGWVDSAPDTVETQTVQRVYDSLGRLESETDARLTQTVNEYDPEGRYRAARREAVGTAAERRTEYTRDTALNRELERLLRNAAGEVEMIQRTAYNARGQVTASCSIAPDVPAAMAYTCGQQTHAPEGVRQSLTSYCEQVDVEAPGSTCPILGLLKSMDGPRTDVTDVTQYEYFPQDAVGCSSSPADCAYRKGDLRRVTNALNQATEFLAYDGAGRVKRLRDANGVVSEMDYHPRGWVTARRTLDPIGGGAAETRFDYNATGDITRVTQPDGAWINYDYDDARRLSAISDRFGNRIDYELDNAGNRLAERVRDTGGSLVRESRRVFDQLGRLDQQLDAQNIATQFDYDANGNQTSTIDGLASETRQEYDPLNRLRSTIQDYLGLGAETGFDYDALDRLVTVTDPNGLVTEYGYDGLGNLRSLTSPDTGLTEYQADSAGNRIWQRDARGVETDYGFDALNRLLEIRYADASFNVAFEYDIAPAECPTAERFGQGRLGRMIDRSGQTVYCYTARGQLARKRQTQGGVLLETVYEYTVADRLARLFYPSGAVARYERDAMGRVTRLYVAVDGIGPTICMPGSPCRNETTLLSSVQHQPFGGASRLKFFDFRDSWVMELDLDLDGRVTSLTSPDGLLSFGYDAVGNIDSLQNKGGELSIGYDPLYRLDRVEVPQVGVLEDYSYDATGNRLTELDPNTGMPLAYTYAPGTHRLLSRGGDLREMDAAGNSVRIAGRYFDYGPNGRLVAVRNVGNGSPVADYAHNGRGERVRKALAGGAVSLFTYGQNGELLGEYQESGKPGWDFIWLDGRPVGAIHEGQLWAIESDHLGTPRALRNRRGIAHWRWDLLGNAFGAHAAQTDPDGDGKSLEFPLRYPGQYYDAETGLHYNYFRDYEAATGRYIESDLIGLDGGVSTFAYVSSSPMGAIDPYGLFGLFDYFNCRMEQMIAGTDLNCGRTIVRAATESTVDVACEAVGDGLKCTATCAVKVFIGADLGEFAINVAEKAAAEAAARVAKKMAWKWLMKGVPIYGQIDTAVDGVHTIGCTIDCVAN